MPRWLPRAMVLALALIAAFQLGSWAFHQLTGLLINVLIAFFLALAIEPAVSWMAGRGMRRGFATFLVFLAVLIAAAGFVTLLGSMLAGQIVKMVEEFPDYLDSVINWVNGHFHTELRRVDIQEDCSAPTGCATTCRTARRASWTCRRRSSAASSSC